MSTKGSQENKNPSQTFLDATQITSMKGILQNALNYHYSNYALRENEIIGDIFEKWDQKTIEEKNRYFDSFKEIKFEVLAYLLHLRRFRHFIFSLIAKGKISVPRTVLEKEIWTSLMEKGGVLEFYCNKWMAHRSYDDPSGETEHVHLEMLLNLEGSMIMHDNQGVFFSFDSRVLRLSKLHHQILRFIDWVFDEVTKNN